ncbi:MAG TPA: lysophospholipid acyltransferase family protein [Fimbriiglobus sp.]|nr:lysophospholipid acyltransferase family protein [Fimbriiglobus sp.]
MKIRNKHLLRAAGWLATRSTRALIKTLRHEYRPLGPVVAPADRVPPGTRYIYCIWHEYLLLPTAKYGHPELSVLISKHADGQLLGSLIQAMGMGMVLGSTNRGGIEAVRQLVNGEGARRHLVITPDGPRGPRRVLQPGIVYVASRTGMQIAPIAVGYDRPWRAGSWDRFAVPRPRSRVRLVTDQPITVPPGVRSDELERYRLLVQAEMDRLTIAAEQWAETNRFEAPALPAEPAAPRLAS